MGRFNGRNSHSQLSHMRARLRKASCLSDDAYEDQAECTQPQAIASSSHSIDVSSLHPARKEAMSAEEEPEEQLQSAFFNCLPIELRRMVYTSLFTTFNPHLKMHLHACHDSARLTITPCLYIPSATFSTRDDEVDPMRTDPWPGWRGKNQPPRWFWHAWGLRLRWGPHWKCQAATMGEWKARGDGTCEDLRTGRGPGWLGMFLTCRRM